jgi:predicted transport protein
MNNYEEHVKYAQPAIRPLVKTLDQRIMALGSLSEPIRRQITPAQRFAYQIGTKQQFLEVKVQREAVLLRFKRTILRDEKSLVRDIPKSHGWTSDQEILITNAEELEYAMRFAAAAFEKSKSSRE